MKIKDLIKKLEKFDPEMEVVNIDYGGTFSGTRIIKIKNVKKGNDKEFSEDPYYKLIYCGVEGDFVYFGD